MFVLYPKCLWLREEARSVLHVNLFWKDKLMTLIFSLISWAVSLQSAMLSRRAGHLRMLWHVQVSRWRHWHKVLLLTRLICLHVSSKMESVNLRKTWVLFFNVSLKMHADVVAGSQLFRLKNGMIKNFMNKYVNPPNNSSLATSFII